jgi:hypothetical protein
MDPDRMRFRVRETTENISIMLTPPAGPLSGPLNDPLNDPLGGSPG